MINAIAYKYQQLVWWLYQRSDGIVNMIDDQPYQKQRQQNESDITDFTRKLSLSLVGGFSGFIGLVVSNFGLMVILRLVTDNYQLVKSMTRAEIITNTVIGLAHFAILVLATTAMTCCLKASLGKPTSNPIVPEQPQPMLANLGKVLQTSLLMSALVTSAIMAGGFILMVVGGSPSANFELIQSMLNLNFLGWTSVYVLSLIVLAAIGASVVYYVNRRPSDSAID